MTVAFIDPPGPLTGTNEVIDFTTDRLVTSISIEFNPTNGNGLRETVWDGSDSDGSGDFSYAYRNSSRTGSGPYTWHVKRASTWPAEFRIRVQEQPVPTPAPTTFWEVLYEKDLRTLPNQTIFATSSNAYANFTADSQPWYGYVSSGTMSIVNGVGITGLVSGHGLPYGGVHAGLKLYQMAGWDAAKETAVQVRMAGTTGGYIAGAICWSDNDENWGYGPGDDSFAVWVDANISRAEMATATGNQNIVLGAKPTAEDWSNWVFATSQMPYDRTNTTQISLTTKNLRAAFASRDIATWPTMENMRPMGAAKARSDIPTTAHKAGFYAGKVTLSATYTATHIRVLQRTVV